MYDQLHHIAELTAVFCGLLLLFTAVKHYAQKTVFPSEAWILLLGMAYGLAAKNRPDWNLPDISLDPAIVLILILPLLIFASGRKIRLDALKSQAISTGFLAIPGVILTAFLIAWPLAVFLGIPLTHTLVLGAALGAIDPTAVTSIFQRFKIPERLKTLVEGESLFNDGTTVVLFSLVSGLALNSGMFTLSHSAFDFGWSVLVAVPLGILTGWLASWLLCFWCCEDRNFMSTSLTIVLAYTAYLIAEELLHVSGVISVLVAAITFSRLVHKKEKTEHENANVQMMDAFWEYITQTLNAFLFFMLGATTGAHDFSGLTFGMVAAAILAMIFSRVLLIYGSGWILKLSLPWQNVLVLGGLRGGISAALILLIPTDYAHYQLFMCLAFAMIAFTLIVQPPLIQFYLKKSGGKLETRS